MTGHAVPRPGAATLERLLGNPYDQANPYGFHAILAADERGEPFRAGGELLDTCGLTAGQPSSQELLEAMRAVFRRAPALAHGRAPAGPYAEAVRVGATTGALDSGLRITLRHLLARRLYGRAAIDIPYLRAVLAGVFADLLLCDSLTTAAARGIDVLPSRRGAHRHAVRDVVPRVVQDAMDRLSIVLGSRFYIRVGETAVFQLLLRESQWWLFGSAAPLAGPEPGCVAEVLSAPYLAELCEPAWLAVAPGRLRREGGRRARPPESVERQLFDELLERYDSGRSFGLAGHRVPDRP
ncbi:hypothetical protein [Streptomyces sp. 7N604]|uniref:hypothetical protein n=1 Tax=Streptomyces sp. 7N604 TaxID=3457415 RepID=UPI003FCF7DDA